MILCRLFVIVLSKSWISNKCYGICYEEVEVYVVFYKWSIEGNFVIYYFIYEFSKKFE